MFQLPETWGAENAPANFGIVGRSWYWTFWYILLAFVFYVY
jgi:hypothetical protein